MMGLKDIVAKYLEQAGEFGKPVALSAFGLSRDETEKIFSALEEDYHISRFVAFSHQPSAVSQDQTYQINGFPQTHATLAQEIQKIL
jgi:hypothetical protein